MVIFGLLTLITVASAVLAVPEHEGIRTKRYPQNPPPCPPLTCPQKVTRTLRSQSNYSPKSTPQGNQPMENAAFWPKVESNTISKRDDTTPPCPPLTCPQQLKRKLQIVVTRQALDSGYKREADKKDDATPPCPPLTCPQQLKRMLQYHSGHAQPGLSKSSLSVPFWHRESSGQKMKKAQNVPPCPPLTCPQNAKRLFQSKLDRLELSVVEALAPSWLNGALEATIKRDDPTPPCPPLTCPQNRKRSDKSKSA